MAKKPEVIRRIYVDQRLKLSRMPKAGHRSRKEGLPLRARLRRLRHLQRRPARLLQRILLPLRRHKCLTLWGIECKLGFMIQGYAIYLRTHRETGRQYGGCVWWTNSNGTAEKSCARRWKIEDRIGIRGLFGGFDSKMILTEVRSDAPEMSEGLYRIRIASDEQTTIDRIAADRRLNLINPLGVFGGLELREEFCRLGGRNAAQACKEKGIGIFGLSEDQQKQTRFPSLK